MYLNLYLYLNFSLKHLARFSFLDALKHLYNRPCPSVGRSVTPLKPTWPCSHSKTIIYTVQYSTEAKQSNLLNLETKIDPHSPPPILSQVWSIKRHGGALFRHFGGVDHRGFRAAVALRVVLRGRCYDLRRCRRYHSGSAG